MITHNGEEVLYLHAGYIDILFHCTKASADNITAEYDGVTVMEIPGQDSEFRTEWVPFMKDDVQVGLCLRSFIKPIEPNTLVPVVSFPPNQMVQTTKDWAEHYVGIHSDLSFAYAYFYTEGFTKQKYIDIGMPPIWEQTIVVIRPDFTVGFKLP